MLRYDAENSRPGLGRKIIRTWFQTIFDLKKMVFLVLQVVSPAEVYRTHETYVPKQAKNQTSCVVYHITI